MQPSQGQLLFTAVDPRGRVVSFCQAQRDHIDQEHPEVKSLDIRRAIETAQVRTSGAFAGAELLWTRNLGPTRWLVVVVAYEGRIGRVLTAYGAKKGPPAHKHL